MNSINTQNNSQATTNIAKAAYTKPVLKNAGSLAELTQGFSGSVPDESGGHTKRNPFQG